MGLIEVGVGVYDEGRKNFAGGERLMGKRIGMVGWEKEGVERVGLD